MATKERNRTLRPSSREVDSSYKIDTKNIHKGDTLVINIDHEDNPGNILFQYELDGDIVDNKNSIHFKAYNKGGTWEILWSGANPIKVL